MGSRFSRRSYREQTYIDGRRVTPKLLKALADAEQAEAAAIALKEKQVMVRLAKRDAALQAKADAEAAAQEKIEKAQVEADEAKEE